MIGDAVTPRDRLRCVAPKCWQWKLAACIIALAIILALMCENVNAAPQAKAMTGSVHHASAAGPAVAAPFTLAHPLCQTGFWIKQRIDDRDRNNVIIKSRWVFGCAKGRIVYGRKV
jgi:hypothetical protein